MDEYTCKKCGAVCVIEWYDDKCPGGWPSCFCDDCEDDAGGFDNVALDLQADRLAEMCDRAHDQAKERNL